VVPKKRQKDELTLYDKILIDRGQPLDMISLVSVWGRAQKVLSYKFEHTGIPLDASTYTFEPALRF
jgi:hypothetical protein